ncbi:single-stranded-DNA-specific exonuclease RecJ [Spirulina sp. 06S082]|uniref:single-stranded-DNA-specific exonuclease RecJ n=1 Tax=Spirulina sp. 06S082 TaxID=3110248 RepID=UPI002B1F0FAE|nr:single-stranded-DNA-specific exonuclease RecJ [Spirulina sp. 06S082]MEA5470502.1 single-stranded-DNA-specific exonuclease RecJ [Spirulina sp. 06S082]
MTTKIPQQRWHIASESPEQIADLVKVTGLSPLLAQVLIQRGIKTPEQAQFYLNPETEQLPLPLEEFPDLKKSVDLLEEAISDGEKIAICGDYDADGMTSTALLLRALRAFGANVDYAIPSRMKDGYGINERIVTELAEQGVGLILTVDNGISAYDPIALAVDLGISVIITDHHEVPEKIPPADAILNPKLIPENSPYRGLAGVGVAYILAVTTGQRLGTLRGLTNTLLELFTLGTIADLAPLTGVNRRWLKRGLRKLAKSELAGVQALMELSGVKDEKKPVKPDAIGFRLGPRINAVGRINEPEIVIELLTTDDKGIALERAMQCEATNRQRQHLCEQIELEAIQQIEAGKIDYKKDRVLVIFGETWHHGVIGIVASRLVERYGVPVFICTSETDKKMMRGSARGIPEFNVFEALNYCQDLLGKFGGHHAAGGFSFAAENFSDFQKKLSEFACQCLQIEHLKPLVNVDTLANLDCVTAYFYEQIESLQPWGIGNATPVFWTPNVRLLDQQTLRGNHLKLTLGQKIAGKMYQIKAIAWRWGEYYPLPKTLDIAYKLKENTFNGATNIELEIVGVRPATQTQEESQNEVQNIPSNPEIPKNSITKAKFVYKNRSFNCSFWSSLNELRIKNDRGEVLVLTPGAKTALLGKTRDTAKELDMSNPYLLGLVKAALDVLKISENKAANVG